MKKTLNILSLLLIPAAILLSAFDSSALPIDYYSAASKLAEGKWVKIKVASEGMNLISDAQLRQWGFNKPEDVHVYGLGGQQLNNGLDTSNPDDLPLVPSVKTGKGLVFFASGINTWTATTDTARPYSHWINQYNDDIYYFISDVPVESTEMPAAQTSASGASESLTTFTDRIIHEAELDMAGESGCQVYGEDFRTKKSQTFPFTLTDAADDEARAYVRFAAKTTNGSSTLLFSANGKQLEATNKDVISRVLKATSYCVVTETAKKMSGLDGSLDFGIDYSYSGVLFMARLDYIELFYERHTRLHNGELHFFGKVESGQGYTISGCTENTVIWDITDRANPMNVTYTLSGDKASFRINTTGYHEYIAFNPESISRAVTSAGTVSNQNIHGMDIPDMVIITLPEYRAGAERIAALHSEHDGMDVTILTPELIYNEFSGGKPDVGAFRRLLKMWYDRGLATDNPRLQYCLLMGKPLYDNKLVTSDAKNAGFKPLLIWQSYNGLEEESSYCTDDYIAALDDVTDKNFELKKAKLRVAIGRLPVTSSQESLAMAAKLEKYIKQPDYGSWRNKVMIIADDDDNGQHLNQAQRVWNSLRSSGNGESFVYDRVYLDSYKRVMTGVGPTYPQATERMMRNYNDGVMLTDYIGHASAVGWGHEKLWEWESIISMTNKNLMFIYAATCGFAYWDTPTPSGAEHLILNPESGAIGMMAAARTVYIDKNGLLNESTMKEMFARNEDGRPRTFGEVYRLGKNQQTDENKLRYVYLGDPAIRIPSGIYDVKVTSLNDFDMTDLHKGNADFPELPAMSTVKVKGEIRDTDGSIRSDFSGTVNLQLFDSERVITTYGQGKNGKVISYNDRDKLLSSTNAVVKDGRWEAVMRIPPEIQGNYTPAMIASYAWSDTGEEANGVCEQFYVFGYDDSAVTDKDAPVIEQFYVNNPEIAPGTVVNANPVVFARLRDESGINISQSGIGHSLTLSIDDNDFRNDLTSYFAQDASDPDAGTLIYPLEGITPGTHTLTLTVWDNANNVSKATLDINVGAMIEPVIYDITASTGDTSDTIDFRIHIDRPNTSMKCTLGIYDLSGRKLKETTETLNSDLQSVINTRWDMTDDGGNRVPRGIYIYRATIESPEGTTGMKSKKIAVAAQ